MTLSPDLDPQLAGLLGMLAAAGAPPMSQGTAEEARTAFRTLAVDLRDPASVPEVAEVRDLHLPGGAEARPARLYRPRQGELPTVLFLHGGGFVIGDLDTHDLTCRTLALHADCVVVSLDYRLAPEHPFPAGLEDSVAAAAWVSDHLDELGGSPVMGVAGDSAGGNLSAVVAQVFRDQGRSLGGQLLIYPATDMGAQHPSFTENAEGYFLDADTMAWFAAQYVGTDGPDLGDARLSPRHGSLSDLAPAVVVTAQFDPLRDDGNAYAEALAAAGVPVQHRVFPGMIHGFVDMGRHSAAAQSAIEETFGLFREVLHG